MNYLLSTHTEPDGTPGVEFVAIFIMPCRISKVIMGHMFADPELPGGTQALNYDKHEMKGAEDIWLASQRDVKIARATRLQTDLQ